MIVQLRVVPFGTPLQLLSALPGPLLSGHHTGLLRQLRMLQALCRQSPQSPAAVERIHAAPTPAVGNHTTQQDQRVWNGLCKWIAAAVQQHQHHVCSSSLTCTAFNSWMSAHIVLYSG
jgi:hypothetical protein